MTNTGNISAGFEQKNIFPEFVLVEPSLGVNCYFATKGQTQNNPCHFVLVIHDLSSESR